MVRIAAGNPTSDQLSDERYVLGPRDHTSTTRPRSRTRRRFFRRPVRQECRCSSPDRTSSCWSQVRRVLVELLYGDLRKNRIPMTPKSTIRTSCYLLGYESEANETLQRLAGPRCALCRVRCRAPLLCGGVDPSARQLRARSSNGGDHPPPGSIRREGPPDGRSSADGRGRRAERIAARG